MSAYLHNRQSNTPYLLVTIVETLMPQLLNICTRYCNCKNELEVYDVKIVIIYSMRSSYVAVCIYLESSTRRVVHSQLLLLQNCAIWLYFAWSDLFKMRHLLKSGLPLQCFTWYGLSP